MTALTEQEQVRQKMVVLLRLI